MKHHGVLACHLQLPVECFICDCYIVSLLAEAGLRYELGQRSTIKIMHVYMINLANYHPGSHHHNALTSDHTRGDPAATAKSQINVNCISSFAFLGFISEVQQAVGGREDGQAGEVRVTLFPAYLFLTQLGLQR